MVCCYYSFSGRRNALLIDFVILVFIILLDLSECRRETSLHLTLPKIQYTSLYYEDSDDKTIASSNLILGGRCTDGGNNNLI